MADDSTSALPDVGQVILDEAIDWLVLLQSGAATDHDRAELARWCQRSPAHEATWQRAEGVLDTFRQVPSQLGRDTFARLPGTSRRELLAMLMLAVPGAWLAWRHMPWQEWTADLRTATGVQKTMVLADGTRLVLNTATAVDVAFTPAERRITLVAGEILITTAQDPSPVPRPFIVCTSQGRLRPLGTRFNVRSLGGSTRVAVFEGAVEVRPVASALAVVVRAGEQMAFTAGELQAMQPADASAALWAQGMLLACDMCLGDLVTELARYHHGILRCDPAAAGLTVSGAFPVMDTEASLIMLERSLPVRIGRATSYWITVHAR